MSCVNMGIGLLKWMKLPSTVINSLKKEILRIGIRAVILCCSNNVRMFNRHKRTEIMWVSSNSQLQTGVLPDALQAKYILKIPSQGTLKESNVSYTSSGF